MPVSREDLLAEMERRGIAPPSAAPVPPAPPSPVGVTQEDVAAEMQRRGLTLPAAAEPEPEPIDTEPNFNFLIDAALPTAGSVVGAAMGSPLGPLGMAAGGAGGAAIIQMLIDYMDTGAIDPANAAITGAMGAIPGGGAAASKTVGGALKEFAPDIVGTMLGGATGYIGQELIPELGQFGVLGDLAGTAAGAKFGRKAALKVAPRAEGLKRRTLHVIGGKKRGSDPTTSHSRNPADVASNAEREARLRRELLGIAE